jgi:hypothetical protein
MDAMKTTCLALVTIGLLGWIACSRPADSEEAVRAALERYLSSRPNLNMGGMDMQIGAITFRADSAEADVTFRARNDSKAALSMHYKLRRRSNGWEVEPQTGGHGGMMPPGSSGPSGQTPEMPPGHPSVGAPPPAGELPPGHPPLKSQ